MKLVPVIDVGNHGEIQQRTYAFWWDWGLEEC
jgi:hypothetical protein